MAGCSPCSAMPEAHWISLRSFFCRCQMHEKALGREQEANSSILVEDVGLGLGWHLGLLEGILRQ